MSTPTASAANPPMLHKLVLFLRRGTTAGGAVLAQLIQALTSLLIQIVAIRYLGTAGFGVFALLYSGMVLSSAIVSGLVGDSLTVLDRSDGNIRSGLLVTALVTSTVLGSAVLISSLGHDDATPATLILVGILTVVFCLEELLRRVLMATLKFWSVVIVDISCLISAAFGLTLLIFIRDEWRLVDILVVMLFSQIVGMVTALIALPRHERKLGNLTSPSVGPVLRYGSWRAAQQGVRPAIMTGTRLLIVAAVGASLFGEIEAARLYTSPAMLIVNGIGGFLFASYARDPNRALRELIHLADKYSALLIAITLSLGFLTVIFAPIFGGIFTDGSFELHGVAIFGWAAYAASSSVLMPYAGLAAVRGKHALVMGVRIIELVVSVLSVAAVLFLFGLGAEWAPYGLTIGAIMCGIGVRQRVLVPLTRSLENQETPLS